MLPDVNLLPAEALKALVRAQHEQLLWRESEIEHLKLLIAKLQRMQFGRKSEKLARQIEQLELRLEDLQAKPAESASQPESSSAAAASPLLNNIPAKPVRRPLPAHLPRQTQRHEPKESACPDCGGQLSQLGEDVSEMLEYVPASFFVVRHVRPKLSCTKCDHIVQASAPSRPIERGVAGPGLLAHVLVSKYADHLPLYRQSEIYARQGIELERSTLADWVGGTSRLLEPLIEVLRRYVTAPGKLHADDPPVPVLAPGNGKTKTGGCGRTFGMIVPLGTRRRPQFGLPTRPIEKVNIPRSTYAIFAARYKLMPTLDSINSTKAAGFRKRRAGRTCGASSATCNKRTHRPSPARLWNESQLCMPLRKRSAADHRTSGNRCAQPGRGLCSSPYRNGSKSH
jgi:transposase